MCRAAGPAESSSLFRIIDNRPARGMEERNSRASAILPLQLLLAATATGAENLTYRFVIISIVVSDHSEPLSPYFCLPVSLCLWSFLFSFFFC
ncbi:hypothetical protein CHARACLAT_023320 [Characodon lateralis]|uniref:Uncharacterized protein n=1 Tax=Characodon lateralis TaxID=208331 RepID=A0ABU7F612_9TELE|nr:hypothetical protein [Characodon lateralis]